MEYGNMTAHAIHEQRDQADLNIEAVRLNLIACIFSLELKRNLNQDNPAQRLLVMTAPSNQLPASTAGQLALLEEKSQFVR